MAIMKAIEAAVEVLKREGVDIAFGVPGVSELLQQFAEITGVPVNPTLLYRDSIPDDHDLMAGMVGLQTSHRYDN